MNTAIEAYSDFWGNRLDRLQEYCRRCSYEGSMDDLVERIRGIQLAIFRTVSDKKRATYEEIEEIAREYVNSEASEVNENGVKALLKWVVWTAWREGYLEGGRIQ